MATYDELCAKAVELGHELTPDLRADLHILADVPDQTIREKAREQWVRGMAKKFQVPYPAMDMRLAGTGPFRTT